MSGKKKGKKKDAKPSWRRLVKGTVFCGIVVEEPFQLVDGSGVLRKGKAGDMVLVDEDSLLNAGRAPEVFHVPQEEFDTWEDIGAPSAAEKKDLDEARRQLSGPR